MNLRHAVVCLDHFCDHHHDPDPVAFRSQLEKLAEEFDAWKTTPRTPVAVNGTDSGLELGPWLARRLREVLEGE